MKARFIFTPLILLIFSSALLATQVKGTVKDINGNPLPYASIYVKNSSLGVSTDLKGRYTFELDAGSHTLVFSYLGYQALEREINLEAGEVLTLDIQLEEQVTELGVVEVYSDSRGLANKIMAKVRANRKAYLHQLETYKCETYTKVSLDRKLIKPSKNDTLLVIDDGRKLSKKKKKKLEETQKKIKENRAAFFSKDNLELVETVSELYYKHPGAFKEVVIANQDYSKQFHHENSVYLYSDFGEIAPVEAKNMNPHLIYKLTEPDFNFYKNTIDFPSICSKPLLSPLAFNAPLSYSYQLEGSFIEEGKKVYKIKVIPRFKSDALFHGLIFIQDSTFSITSVDLEINRPALHLCREFKILQNYELQQGKYSLPIRREILYTIREGKNNFLGSVSIRHKNYQVNPKTPQRFFNTEVKTYAEDAFDKDSLFWTKIRPVTLKKEELHFIIKADSIQNYYESPAYKHRQDSLYNHIGIIDVLFAGFGHRDSDKRYGFGLYSLLEQIHPFGVGGYRHSLGGNTWRTFKNDQILHFSGMIDYGVINKDVKGNIGLGFTFLPKKFMRTFVRYGDTYEQINNYESIIGIFSRANYVRAQKISLEQKMEIVNGLFAELVFTVSNKKPIDSLNFSKDLFAELGTPVNFDEYKKTEIKLRLQYRPFQKHYFVHNKKVILGSDWPEFFLEYRKGLQGVFGSEVNYDYLELGAKDYRQMGRWGYSNWAVKAGSFINSRSLRPFEHKFFRASDAFFFSNPLLSFQLLEISNKEATGELAGSLKTLNTKNEYLQLNYIHHFDGLILNKIPLVRYLKLELAAGAGTLLIRDLNFAHFELFAGLERKVTIFQQLFRFGIYGVTADNSLENAKFRFKIGASIYSTYSQKWDF